MTIQSNNSNFETASHLERAMRRVLGVAVTLILGMPGIALAQSLPPLADLGVQLSEKTSLTVPLKHRGPRFRLGDLPSALPPATPNATQNIPASTPPPTAWQRVKPGRTVWVTTNTGSMVHGKIAAISDSSLIIREQDREVTIRLDDVRLVEGRDSLKNGFQIGAAVGAVTAGWFGWVVTQGCEYECTDSGGAMLTFGVAGAAVGGLFGLMLDRLVDGRQTLVGSRTTVVMPVITPTKKAIEVSIRLR